MNRFYSIDWIDSIIIAHMTHTSTKRQNNIIWLNIASKYFNIRDDHYMFEVGVEGFGAYVFIIYELYICVNRE